LSPESSLHLWADLSTADFVADRGWLEGDTHPRQQANYQNRFLLGKLSSIPTVANLAATQSLPSESLNRVRRRLAAMDNLSAEQPELDRVLAQLGITDRLKRGDDATGASRLSWQRVPNSRPLCEFFSEAELGPGAVSSAEAETIGKSPNSPVKAPRLRWQWTSTSRLMIELESAVSGTLVVRQFNDGGWRVAHSDGPPQPLPIGQTSKLFIEIPVSSATTRVEFQRKWLW
jgi:hypothetical protein